MDDDRKTKKQLIEELKELRQCVAELKGFGEEIEQIRVNQEKFTKAFLQNSIPVGITTLKEGRIVDVSDASLRLMGHKRDEVIGLTSIEIGFITEDQRSTFFDELNKKGRVENLEMKVRTKDGALRDGLFNAVMMSLKNEKYLLTVMTDLTEHKRAEEALHKEKDFADSIIQTAQAIVLLLDTKGHIVSINPYMEAISGHQLKEVQGKDWFSTFLPELDRNRIRELFLNAIDDIQTHGNVNPIVTKDGRELIIEWYDKTLKDEKGNAVGLVAIGQDITDRKQAEEEKAKLEAQTRQLQKAESLGRMAGAIAHTFNNQLGVVIGNLELAIDDLKQGEVPVISLNAAMQAAEAAAAVSGLMLTYLGQTSGKHEPLDLSDACLRSLPILWAIMPGKVVLETDLPSPGPVISANASQIQQVLTNLITNAWEAVGEDGGSIHLGVKTVSPSEITAPHFYPLDWQLQNNTYACLEVADRGCGIADEDIDKLFDPFFSSKFTGRGMGLPVVMGILRAHSGAITMKSEPGRGSAFRVFFPVSAEEILRQPDKAIQPLKMEGGGTVLLVEDEEMLRNMATAMFKRLGFAVLEAKDGVEAVEVFRQHQDEICCVLCDLTMPRMNGWETLTALRNIAPDVPVILASGYDKARVMAGDHPELPQAFLGKPYKLKKLSDAISHALVSKKK